MNTLGFVNDGYTSVNIDHYFNRFFINKIPLLKKLLFRETISCKVLVVGLSDSNNPGFHHELFQFPVNYNGEILNHTLEKKPYIEGSIGIANIFQVLRVDFIKRFSYLKYPAISKTRIRLT